MKYIKMKFIKKIFILVAVLCVALSLKMPEALARESDCVELTTRGATIWPICDVTFYDRDYNAIGTIEGGTPLKVRTQNEKYFKIYYNGKTGYVENAYCMINLPDIMQEELLYDITNSYSSIYKIHGYDIENVTGEVLYPYVELDDGEYLVPLLYPVALHLYDAEEEALSLGYTLKIYDAYRPHAVSTQIYELTTQFVEANPEYSQMMTESVDGESYGQSNFLAKSVSNHNYGVALDLTIADLATGKELEMQSAMHELSTRSVISLNNSAATLLQDIMVENGFGTLRSEWWHFEIRDLRTSYAEFQVEPYSK